MGLSKTTPLHPASSLQGWLEERLKKPIRDRWAELCPNPSDWDDPFVYANLLSEKSEQCAREYAAAKQAASEQLRAARSQYRRKAGSLVAAAAVEAGLGALDLAEPIVQAQYYRQFAELLQRPRCQIANTQHLAMLTWQLCEKAATTAHKREISQINAQISKCRAARGRPAG